MFNLFVKWLRLYELEIAFALLVILIVGVFFYGQYTAHPTIQENIAPAVAQSLPDSSVIVERASESLPKVINVPKPFKEERRMHFVVKTKPTKDSPVDCKCEAATLDLSLDRDASNGQRVIANAGNGTIIEAKDSPQKAITFAADPNKWRAWIGYSTKKEYSIGVSRDLGSLVVGAEAEKRAGEKLPVIKATLGIAF